MNIDVSIAKVWVLKISFLAVLTVAVIELLSGLLLNSLALVSDAMHALFDAFTSFILLVTARISLRPADENHPYGHGKYEALGGFTGGIILLGVAVAIGFKAFERITLGFEPLDPGIIGFSAALYAFIIHLARILILNPGKFRGSYIIKADFIHAVSDLSSTIIALLGLTLVSYNIKIGDAIAGMILSILLSFASLRLIWSTLLELSDTIPKSTYRGILSTILENSNVIKLKSLKMRRTSSKYFIDATVTLRNGLTLEKAHEISTRIEESIRRILKEAEVTIHMEPKDDENLISKIKSIALGQDGVRGVHNVKAIYTSRGLNISLHVELDSEIPLGKAHETAEIIERNIREYVDKTAIVTVHLEPSTDKVFNGHHIEEDLELVEAIKEITLKYPEVRRIGRITAFTYMGRKHVNMSCSLDSNLKLSEAHSITTRIEEDIKKKIRNSEVTIHPEPTC